MNGSKSSKSNSTLILALILVALITFIVIQHFSMQEDLDAIRAQIKVVDTANKREIDKVFAQMNTRYVTLLKQAQDIDQQRGKLAAVDRSIAAEREALSQIEGSFHSELSQMKKMGTDSSREVTQLEDKFNQEIKGKAVKLAKLEDDYQGIKTELEDQQSLLVMMREQALLDKYKHPDVTAPADPTPTISANGPTVDANTPMVTVTPSPETTVPSAPVGSAAPGMPASGNVVPTNSRVVTDLPSPAAPTAPVPSVPSAHP